MKEGRILDEDEMFQCFARSQCNRTIARAASNIFVFLRHRYHNTVPETMRHKVMTNK